MGFMDVKRASVHFICLCILNVFVFLSKYPIKIKGITIFTGSIIFILCYISRKMIKLWIGLYVMIMLILNSICFANIHYIYMATNNDTYNKNTKWMTTQTDYNWNTGNCDIILSSILRDKSVYIIQDEKYMEYIHYFSAKICLLNNQGKFEVDFPDLREKFIPLGRMTPHSAPWLWSADIQTELAELRANFDTTPRLYISSEHVAKKEKNLVAVSDKGYNLYIWPYDEFKEMMDGS